MKKIILLLFLLIVFKDSFCQVNAAGDQAPLFMLSLGADKMLINNPAFDTWTESNYNRKIGYSLNAAVDLSVVFKSYDVGMHIITGSPAETVSIYGGKRLTPLNSKVSSFIELQFGEFVVRPGVAPVDYVLTANQPGKKLELDYNAIYFGMTSKNYLNALHFKMGKGKRSFRGIPDFTPALGTSHGTAIGAMATPKAAAGTPTL